MYIHLMNNLVFNSFFLIVIHLSMVLLNANSTDLMSENGKSEQQMDCNLQQNGFHLFLNCNVTGINKYSWKNCFIQINLPSGIYADPYEIMSIDSKMEFKIFRIKNYGQEGSTLSRFFNWFMYGSNVHKVVLDTDELQQIGPNEVDVEAPEWNSEPVRLILFLDYLEGVMDNNGMFVSKISIPLHVRYHLPLETQLNEFVSIRNTSFDQPLLIYSGSNVVANGGKECFKISVLTPYVKDLLLVMPFTIICLIIGIIVLLMA